MAFPALVSTGAALGTGRGDGRAVRGAAAGEDDATGVGEGDGVAPG